MKRKQLCDAKENKIEKKKWLFFSFNRETLFAKRDLIFYYVRKILPEVMLLLWWVKHTFQYYLWVLKIFLSDRTYVIIRHLDLIKLQEAIKFWKILQSLLIFLDSFAISYFAYSHMKPCSAQLPHALDRQRWMEQLRNVSEMKTETIQFLACKHQVHSRFNRCKPESRLDMIVGWNHA